MITFAPEKIDQRLRELGMDYRDLAEKMREESQSVETARNYVHRLIHQQTSPTSKKIAKLAEALNTDVNYFFRFEGVHTLKTQKTHEVLIEKEKPTLKKVMEDIRLIMETEKRPFNDLGIELAPGQRAVVVVVDNKGEQENAFLDRAIGMMQGVREVVDVPLNGKGVDG
jgi:transcriptional regulator with XRE-family HTH domain